MKPKVLGSGPATDTSEFPHASLVTRKRGMSLDVTFTESSSRHWKPEREKNETDRGIKR